MNVVLWVVAGLLAAAFLGAGLAKVSRPVDKLGEMGMGWAPQWGTGWVRFIGAAEILGALGLILPALLDIAPVLVPIAATGLAIIMAGAIVVHVRRKEMAVVVPNLVLLLLAAFVAWGRFGPYAF